uniref:Uncharacterized protein n=1 Tax=Anguilla anguilla TaxID=7936 RepID=A0A0E9TZM0_ANGAN
MKEMHTTHSTHRNRALDRHTVIMVLKR